MDLSVCVITPTGRDAELITAVLRQDGIAAAAYTVKDFLEHAKGDAALGPLLIAEEALTPHVIHRMGKLLQLQPPWSDLPILILTGNGRESIKDSHLATERLPLGSPVLLERPIRTATLVSSVHAAVRARQR